MRRICKRKRQAPSLRDFVALTCSDITAYVLIFHENDKFQLVPFFWIPEEKMLEKIRKENIKPDKEKFVQKIDGIVASIMALGEWMTKQADEDSDPYSQRGMLSLD